MIDTSIIIVNYNCKELIYNCIETIFQKTIDLNYEIIIIDNNSSETFELNSSRKNLRYLKLPSNIGFGKANNEGIRIASGRNILFLNPDTLLINNAIKILSDFIDNHSEIAACGGNLYDINGNPVHSYCMQYYYAHISSLLGLVLLGGHFIRWRFGLNAQHNFTGKSMIVEFITGANLMVRSKDIKNKEAFNPSFFMYSEDAELCYRLRKQTGKEIISVPKARIIHLEGKSIKLNVVRERMIEESKKIYFQLIGLGSFRTAILVFLNKIFYYRKNIFTIIKNII